MNQSPEKSPVERIRDQIEYYFGDINLNKHGYLRQLVQEDGGWVSIEAVKQFKRLKRMMTKDDIDIIEALGDSKLIEVSDDCKKIRRRSDKPIPPRNELISVLKKRSVEIMGFRHNVSVDEVLTFLKVFGNVSSVTMCREKDTHSFHGKVLATFDTEKDARKFFNSPFGGAYQGKQLYRKMQLDFEEEMKSFLESEEQNYELGVLAFADGFCVQC